MTTYILDLMLKEPRLALLDFLRMNKIEYRVAYDRNKKWFLIKSQEDAIYAK